MARDEVIRANLLHFGRDLRADIRAVLAARVEFASLRRVHRGRDIAFQNHEFAVAVHVGGRDRGKQGFGVRVQRMVEELLRIGELHQIAEVHDADPVGDVLHDGEVMRDEEIGKVFLFLQILQKIDDLGLDRNVQRIFKY